MTAAAYRLGDTQAMSPAHQHRQRVYGIGGVHNRLVRGIRQRRASGGHLRHDCTPITHSNTVADLLALPDLPARPRLRTQLECL